MADGAHFGNGSRRLIRPQIRKTATHGPPPEGRPPNRSPAQRVRFGKEPQQNECAVIFIKNRRKRYDVCGDVVEEGGFAFLRKSPAVATCHRHVAKSRRLIRPQIRKTATPDGVTVFLVEEGGFEPPKRNATDLQSAPFGHSGTPPYEILELVDGFEPPTC